MSDGHVTAEFKLTPGVALAIAFAANSREALIKFSGLEEREFNDAYNDIMNAFQDQIPLALIDCNHWWLGHYWSSGHTCNGCKQTVQAFQCDEPMTGRRFDAIVRDIAQSHAPDCNVRTSCTYAGVKFCRSLP